MNLNPDGAATLCCQSHTPLRDEQGRPFNAQTHSLREIWHSQALEDIRTKMMAGEKLPHCNACSENERYGRDSYRLHSNRTWSDDNVIEKNLATDCDDITQNVGLDVISSEKSLPKYLDIRLGNLCNFKCTACKPLYSSQIERDPVHSKWSTDALYRRMAGRFDGVDDWSQSTQLLTELVDISGNVSRIQLAGGEPTINSTQMNFLRNLCDSGQSSVIDLEVVTNLSSSKNEIYKLFSNFKSVYFQYSIDGIGDLYKYVRYPGKWDRIVENSQKVRAIIPNSTSSINVVLQAINAFNVVQLFDWADSEGIPIDLSIGRGLDTYNDFRILPLALQHDVVAQFESYFQKNAHRLDIAVRKANVLSIFSEIEQTNFSEETRQVRGKNFMHFINDMDKTRGLSLREIEPRIYDGMVAYHGSWDERTRYA